MALRFVSQSYPQSAQRHYYDCFLKASLNLIVGVH
jgi:hypothetical protein